MSESFIESVRNTAGVDINSDNFNSIFNSGTVQAQPNQSNNKLIIQIVAEGVTSISFGFGFCSAYYLLSGSGHIITFKFEVNNTNISVTDSFRDGLSKAIVLNKSIGTNSIMYYSTQENGAATSSRIVKGVFYYIPPN